MRSPRNGAVCPTGAHPGNTGGKKGRSGRKPAAFKEFATRVLTSPTVQSKLEKLAETGDMSVINTLAKYSQQVPATTHEIQGGDRPVEFTLNIPKLDSRGAD